MLYKNYLFIFIFLLLVNCTTPTLETNKISLISQNNYTNKGFALVYSENLYNNGIVSKKIDERSLIIFQKNLKKKTLVKITNILNNKSLIANVGKKSKYPHFNNSVVSLRIAQELQLDLKEPYIEIISIPENSMFVADRAKTFNEEKEVADKAPVNSISINNLTKVKTKEKKIVSKKFLYSIKIADFYFNKTALLMIDRIKNETKINEPKIRKISEKKYRVYLGPFNSINSLQNSYNDINILGFENIEIIKND
jgi:hypothetical protein|tara:strand:- start:2567 stop:3325 length:759 start_codon:yes stop_codon:yes gene_type:complete